MLYIGLYLLIVYPFAFIYVVKNSYPANPDYIEHISIGDMIGDMVAALVLSITWPIIMLLNIVPKQLVNVYKKLVRKIISKKSDASA